MLTYDDSSVSDYFSDWVLSDFGNLVFELDTSRTLAMTFERTAPPELLLRVKGS